MRESELSFFSQQSTPDERIAAEKKAEQARLLERLRILVRSISGKEGLEVTTDVEPQMMIQMAGDGRDARKKWYKQTKINLVTGEKEAELVHIPEAIIERENVAKGKAAHEAGHVAITRTGEFIPDEVMQKLGFSSLIAAVEERPTDQVVRERYSGAGKWVDEARQDSVQWASAATKGKKKLGYIPKFTQLNDLIVYEPHFEEIPDVYDADIIKLYKSIQEAVEQIERTLPEEGASEEEIVRKAKRRYEIAYSKIWPEIKKLVEGDSHKETLRQMIEDDLQSKTSPQEMSEEKPHQEGQGEMPSHALGQLTEDLQKELLSAINQVSQEQKEIEESLQKAKQEPAQGEEGRGAEDDSEKKTSEEETQEGEGEQEGKKESGVPVPMDGLSKDLKDALERIFEKLPKEKQEALKEKAREALEELEDSVVRDLAGQLLDMPPESHKEYKERKEDEEKEKEKTSEKKKIKKELEEIERVQAAVAGEVGVYDKTYEEIREVDAYLYRRLEEIFTPNIKRKTLLKSSGSRINLPAVFRREAEKGAGAKEVESRIFESVHLPEKKDYVVTLLVDLSGSMKGKKIQETFKGVVLLAEVLNRLGITNEIVGFQDEIIMFKSFDQKITDEIRKKIVGMIDEVRGNNPGGHNKPSYNDDGPCLMEASRGLAAQSGKEKFLVVLSDGVPEGRKSTADDLTEAIEKISKTTQQKLIGIGLGPDTGHVKEFYPTSLPNVNTQNLPEVLGELLEDILTNPQKYVYTGK